MQIRSQTYNICRLEVYHSLHCLVSSTFLYDGVGKLLTENSQNRLRQALYPEYYHVFDNPDDPSRAAHISEFAV